MLLYFILKHTYIHMLLYFNLENTYFTLLQFGTYTYYFTSIWNIHILLYFNLEHTHITLLQFGTFICYFTSILIFYCPLLDWCSDIFLARNVWKLHLCQGRRNLFWQRNFFCSENLIVSAIKRLSLGHAQVPLFLRFFARARVPGWSRLMLDLRLCLNPIFLSW
jgi:hypothetical protein